MTSVAGTGREWDAAADFVVLGSGAAGLTGALVAAAGGAKVILLEKASLLGGTTAMSGGTYWIPVNHYMPGVGLQDSRQEALDYLYACEGTEADDDYLLALVDNAAPMLSYLEELGLAPSWAWPPVGGTFDYRPWLPGAKHGGRGLNQGKFALSDLGEWSTKVRVGRPWTIDMLDYYTEQMHLAPPHDRHGDGPVVGVGESDTEVKYVGGGTALVGELLKACLSYGVQPFVDTAAVALVTESGRVAGVRATREARPWLVGAKHGVLVATGGYASSEELKGLWINRPILETCEVPENQGDGHLMGMAIGAQVANLGDAWWIPYIPVGAGGTVKNVQGSREDRVLPHTMIVNQAGRRFINECTNYYDFGEGFGSHSGASKRNFPAWLVFDQQGVDRYAMLAFKVPPGEPPEWLTVGETLTELAQKLGIDAAGLAATAERFNRFATDGRDLDFNRGENPWDLAWGDPSNAPNPTLGTIEKPPFYAVDVVPGALATKGGLRVNSSGQVVSAARPFEPIPGLYAAGNCSNAGPRHSYPGPGITIASAMVFGYLVGRQIAELVA